MKRVFQSRPYTIFEKNGSYFVTKWKFLRGLKWNGWTWTELKGAKSSIKSPNTESQKDYRYKLPKSK